MSVLRHFTLFIENVVAASAAYIWATLTEGAKESGGTFTDYTGVWEGEINSGIRFETWYRDRVDVIRFAQTLIALSGEDTALLEIRNSSGRIVDTLAVHKDYVTQAFSNERYENELSKDTWPECKRENARRPLSDKPKGHGDALAVAGHISGRAL
jgi:hypothetical protein